MALGTDVSSGRAPTTKHVAVFGDLHGHLRLMLQLCRLWQLDHGIHLDAVLQCGDLGYFPNPWNLDKATLRFARKDPEELGFSRYFAPPGPGRPELEKDEIVERVLTGPQESLDSFDSLDSLESLACPVIWVNGNHEDFQALSRLAGGVPGRDALVPVDAFGAFKLLRSGNVTRIAGLRVAGLGGGPEPPNADDDYGMDEPWKWVGIRACNRLAGETFDCLVTHCAPNDPGGDIRDPGSERLRTVIELCGPAYNFHSHHRRPVAPNEIGRTRCFWLSDVNFKRQSRGDDRHGPLNRGCMGILEWNAADDHGFAVLDEPWMRKVTRNTWRHL